MDISKYIVKNLKKIIPHYQKVFVSGSIYEDSEATKVLRNVCDEETVIEKIIRDEIAPYKISEGYVKENSIYVKKEV